MARQLKLPGDSNYSKTTFEPAQLLGPAYEWCKDQTWINKPFTFTITSETLEVIIVSQSNGNSAKVDAIDELVTTPAGTFKSVRITRPSDAQVPADTPVDVSWLAIDTGIVIKQVTTRTNNTVTERVVTKIQ